MTHPIPIKGRDELGEMARALVVFRRNAEELRRSNIELEKFTYVAAHELRSPLRAVHELSVWVIEDEQNSLSAESQAYLCMLQQRIGRLNRLLNDLLDYARAGQKEPAAEQVSLHRLVRELAHGVHPKGCFMVTFNGPEEPVAVLLTPLQQILGNLLSNAIKHHDAEQSDLWSAVRSTAPPKQNAMAHEKAGVILSATNEKRRAISGTPPSSGRLGWLTSCRPCRPCQACRPRGLRPLWRACRQPSLRW
ncbi:histidine kinase dimerization/phospho-acceptor domain-containing protein [Sulfitobacter maritimus]|uniref:histidine kinase dimerization/phospho-acceptor domain-containing protein n=1 Tax=Sulfitobacter maritimus TaxID=2741719 RepID=UPI003CCD51F6